MSADAEVFDAIFVGSGINGLVGAAMLAKKGWKVLVLERAGWLGGAIRTVETAGGFQTELMACWYTQFLGSPAYRALRQDLDRHGLRFLNTSKPMAVVTPDGRSLVLTADHATNAARFEKLRAGEGTAWTKATHDLLSRAGDLLGIRDRYPWSANTARWLFGMLRRRGRAGSLSILSELLASARTWLEQSFAEPMIRTLFAPWALHGSSGPDEPGSAPVVRAVAAFFERVGSPLPAGGGKELPRALAAIVEEHGGRCMTDVDVERIWIEKGTAQGVKAAGRQWAAKQAVICSVTPAQLYERLLADEPISEDIRDHARKVRPGLAMMQIAISLDRAIPWAVEDDLSEVAVIHVSGGLDAVSRASNEARRGLLPAEPTICCGQPMAVDPSRGPAGAWQLWIQLLELPASPVGDAGGEIDVSGGWTEAVREAFADRVQNLLARHLPGLDKAIIDRIVISPVDLEKENINLIGGGSASSDLDQMLLLRPSPFAPAPKTPVKRLYHIGAGTHPGAGLSGASGVLIANHLQRSSWFSR